ncbi:terminase TerL endonuclease subunit [Bacteroides sedimenti]|uniref:Terminase n=1 Tax=Bacteroides sedimenti TaxID=2136147 RepID=A0ABN6Z0X5_9BACE
MIQPDAQLMRELKTETVSRLESIAVGRYNLEATDERLLEYVQNCISDPDGHNVYELLSILRFFSFLDKYEFRTGDVKAFILFYEYLRFSGVKGATRYKLTPVQVFQFANIKGFYYPGTPKRVIRDALLFVPRKFSKTTSVAALAIEDLLFGDANAQAYTAANGYKQAQICFNEIKAILRRLDPKFRRFRINREKVYNLCKGRTSFAECLSSNPDKLDGLNASTVILDEFAQADSADLKNVLTSSMGARLNPLTIIITTASDKSEAPFTEMLKHYKAILRGEIENDSVFAHIFEPDVDDAEDDPRTWRKVQPHMGITVYEDFYQEQWKKAQISAEDMKEFRNKQLNIFTSSIAREWISKDQIEELYLDIPEENLEGLTGVASVDLSVCDDFSAVSYTLYMPHRYRNGNLCPFHSITEYYFPEGQLENHPNRELYRMWIEQGHLKTCKGNVIDYEQIANDILSKPYVLMGLGYDSYKSLEFVKIMEVSVGKDYLYPISQTYGTFTSPVESIELTVNRKQMTFDPNPITAYCFANAVVDEDRMENRKPIKVSHNLKIDGAITNTMNFYLLNNVKMTK